MSNFQQPRNSLLPILSYTPPKLYTGKEWYIGFYAFDPTRRSMRRKKIKINFIEKISDRRQYAKGMIKRLNSQLERGWNPWIEAENGQAYHTVEDVFNHYRRAIEKLFHDDIYREDTYISYLSYIRNLENWNEKQQVPLTYIYQFDSTTVQLFLEHIYIDRDNSPQTRDNYLMWLRSFSTWLVQKKYLKSKPAEGIVSLGKRSRKKTRTVISEGDMLRIKDYLVVKNKHYLLACYILFYCLIRPKEMSKIRICDISIRRQTLFIPDDNSKNRKDGTVTVPAKVLQLMIDLNIFNYPGDYFLFSKNFEPGKDYKSEKSFRDFWLRYLREDLKLPANYKFYSLKDTGITSMLRKHPSISVRDQARHSSLLTTEMYTPHDIQEANAMIAKHDSYF